MMINDDEFVTLEHFFAMFYSNYNTDIKMLKDYTKLYKQMESKEVIQELINQLKNIDECIEQGVFKDILDQYGNNIKAEDFLKHINNIVDELDK